jgi:hypothetical protein
MGMFKSKSGAIADLRKVTERRTREQKWRHDRRVHPDRRLNNISVEWIPFSAVTLRPTIREALFCRKNKNQAQGTSRKEQSLVCIFRNKLAGIVDLRKGTDRRTQQQMRPYNRRVHPDRRLNNISVEWFPYY